MSNELTDIIQSMSIFVPLTVTKEFVVFFNLVTLCSINIGTPLSVCLSLLFVYLCILHNMYLSICFASITCQFFVYLFCVCQFLYIYLCISVYNLPVSMFICLPVSIFCLFLSACFLDAQNIYLCSLTTESRVNPINYFEGFVFPSNIS